MQTSQQDRMARPKTRLELAQAEVEGEQRRHAGVEKRHKSGEQFIQSRLKLEGALERLEQAKQLEAREAEILEAAQTPAAPSSASATIEAETIAPAAAAAHKPPCPRCGARQSSVKSTVGETRYRRCEKCGSNFSTREIVKK